MATEIICEIGKGFIDEENCTPLHALVMARVLITKAKLAGATTCKFQVHVFEDEQNKRSPKRYDWIKFNELLTPVEFWVELKEHCANEGVNFLVTPMSKMAAEKINDLVERWKIGSADLVDLEFLRYIAETQKPVILSTG